ncbi:MAG: LptF/LptG family permease, partial [Verrucomicrobia bacterium]|nr:LptF/LptG family permease [Verrucomicrobiota bacterium]
MKILDRYILRSLLVPLAYCLMAFAMLFIIWDLFEHMSQFLEARTPLTMVGLYYVLLLLPTLEFLAPASLLLAS